jgi:hypothetical protein
LYEQPAFIWGLVQLGSLGKEDGVLRPWERSLAFSMGCLASQGRQPVRIDRRTSPEIEKKANARIELSRSRAVEKRRCGKWKLIAHCERVRSHQAFGPVLFLGRSVWRPPEAAICRYPGRVRGNEAGKPHSRGCAWHYKDGNHACV